MKKRFIDFEGQERVVSLLDSQLEGDSFSHAYLFLGNDGVGKEHLAREFARYILCSARTDDDCPSCHRFRARTHPDLIYIDGSEGIKIEAVRQAIERINLSPNMGAKKVVLFTKAENIGHEAANALLKTLEEPPSDCVIIITAISEKSLPETIVSRSQAIKLQNKTRQEIEKILKKEWSPEEIKEAIELADLNLAEAKKVLRDPEYRQVLAGKKNDLTVIMGSTSIIDKFKIVEKYEKEKDLKSFFDLYAKSIFERLSGAVDNNNEESFTLGVRARKILKIYANLNYNVNLRTAFEALIIESMLNE